MSKLKAFLRKHDLTIGIAGTVFGIVGYFFPWTSSPDLKFYFNKQFNIVSTYKSVDSLSIFYRGRNVVKDGLNLLIQRVKIVNKGSENIRVSDYGLDPFGIRVKNCKIIDASVTKKLGDNYLRATIKPQIVDSNHVHFKKTVFETDKEVYIDLYILHSRKQEPDYTPLGKIVGQEYIDIFDAQDEETDDWWAYFWVILGFTEAIIISIIVLIVIKRQIIKILRWKRKKRILGKYDYPLRELNADEIVLVKMYSCLGEKEFIKVLKDLLNYPEFIKPFWKINVAIGITNEWLETKRFYRLRHISLNTPYVKIHDFLKDGGILIRDPETNIPVKLKDSFLEEIKKALKLFEAE